MTTDFCFVFFVSVTILVISTVNAKNKGGIENLHVKKLRQQHIKNKDPLKTVYQARKKSNQAPGRRPNIVLILTDDQDVDLGSLQFMPKLTKYVREQGAYFSNGFVSTPMCCPSRSSLLTGLYVHNHQVFTNNDNCSSTYWQENHEQRTFATYLSQAGYNTAYFGKYLNKYGGDHVPPGWNEWSGLVRNSRFYNYSINYNGRLNYHGFNYDDDYLPDIVTNRSLAFIEESVLSNPSSPFLAVMSYPGPHGPEDAAPQYQSLFFNVTTHHTPAYDFAPNPDKQWILRHTEKMLPIHKDFTDLLMTKRLQTLQSVDAAIEKVYKTLSDLGQLDNTYIFYTSDHGYHLGQFGLVKGKAFPFDFDTKVPFLVSGPGIAPQSLRSQPVVNIDLAPTFLDIAGLVKPPHMDGKSILPLFTKGNKKFRSSFLIERGKMTYERYEKVKELTNSLWEEEHDAMVSVLNKKKLTKQERLSVECSKSRYQAPCSPDQKWVCKVRNDGTKKISRCKNKLVGQRGSRKKASSCHCQAGETFGWKYSKLDQVKPECRG
jgi:extracellular sulfatase Sulf